MSFWDEKYKGSPAWVIGRPQPVFVEIMIRGEMKPGRLLDVGCGTGDNAIFPAKNGFSVVGIDMVPKAIQLAKTKAEEQKVKADFLVGNALELESNFRKGEFDNVIDSGLFHALEDPERPIFAKQINHVLRDGGQYFMLCFSDKEPPGEGPRRVSKSEIKQTFSPMFKINYIRPTFFAAKNNIRGFRAYVTSATK